MNSMEAKQSIRRVGFLTPNESFETGRLGKDVLDKVVKLAQSRQLLINVRRGYPTCPLCGFSVAEEIIEKGPYDESVVLADVIIPTGDNFFVFPTLLHHYMSVHGYRPPGDFLETIMSLDPEQIDEKEIKGRFKSLIGNTPD